MLYKLGDVGYKPLYSYKYLADDQILIGKNGDEPYIIANPKIAQIIYNSYLKKIRREKLNTIYHLNP